jgi:hypothetical protein
MYILFVWRGKDCPTVAINSEDCTNRGRTVEIKMPNAKAYSLKKESDTSHNQGRS